MLNKKEKKGHPEPHAKETKPEPVEAAPVVADPVPVPDTAPFAATSPELEVRLKALEELVAVHTGRIAALQPPHESLEKRLTALERLVRTQAEDILSRVNAATKIDPGKVKV